MSISDNYVPLRQIGNGVTVAFSSNWNMIASSYARVYLEDAITGVQTPVTEGAGAAQYTLVFTAAGFTVTFNTAPTSANYVVVGREVAQDQTDPYRTSKGFQGDVLEASLDKLTAMVQDLANKADRALKFPLGSTLVGILPGTLIDGATIVWSGLTGTMVNGPTATDIAGAAASAAAAAASAAAAAASAASAVPNANFNANSTTGTNGYTINTGNTSLQAGHKYSIKFTLAQTNTSITITDTSTAAGAKNVRYYGTGGTLQAPPVGTISVGFVGFFLYDGTNFILLNPLTYLKGADVTAAATTDFTQQHGDFVNLIGTTGITAMTMQSGQQISLYYTGAGLSITLGASLALGNVVSGSLALSTGDVLVIRRDGTVSRIISYLPAGGGNISRVVIQKFTSSGTYTPTPGMKSCLVRAVGGGGGGGGVSSVAGGTAAAGGGAGSYGERLLTAAQIGASQTVTIGAGGSAGTSGGGTGGNGGATSLGALLTTTGGNGGTGNTSATVSVNALPGGVGGSGDINAVGQSGGAGIVGTTAGGMVAGFGGSSPFGAGGIGYCNASSNPGNSALANSGAGGSGAQGISTANAGGAGGTGYIVIVEFL